MIWMYHKNYQYHKSYPTLYLGLCCRCHQISHIINNSVISLQKESIGNICHKLAISEMCIHSTDEDNSCLVLNVFTYAYKNIQDKISLDVISYICLEPMQQIVVEELLWCHTIQPVALCYNTGLIYWGETMRTSLRLTKTWDVIFTLMLLICCSFYYSSSDSFIHSSSYWTYQKLCVKAVIFLESEELVMCAIN